MNKILLTSLLAFGIATAYSQDSLQLRRVDSLVRGINQANLQVTRDSIVHDYPDMGLYAKSWLLAVFDGSELKKYENKALAIRTEKGAPDSLLTSTTFYFHQNQLVKVEEWGDKEYKKVYVDWYFWEGRCLYYTLQKDRADERAALLLTMADGLLKIMNKVR